MDELLSNKQIQRFVKKPLRFVIYEELKNMNNWKDLFLNYKNVLLLYSDPLKNIKQGHWVGLKMINNRIIFFDSYGTVPDDTLNEINYPYYPELTRILYYTPYQIHYNPIKLQSDDSAVCGRYVALFIKYCDDDVDEFVSYLVNLAKQMNITTDKLVILLTENIS